MLLPSVLGMSALAIPNAIAAQPSNERYADNRCGGVSIAWLKRKYNPANGIEDWGIINVVLLKDANILWNGSLVTEGQNVGYIREVAAMIPSPITELVIRGDADCALVRRIRATLEQAVDCSIKCEEFAEAEWTELNSPPPPPPRRHRNRPTR